jgi:hypothetical protein
MYESYTTCVSIILSFFLSSAPHRTQITGTNDASSSQDIENPPGDKPAYGSYAL